MSTFKVLVATDLTDESMQIFHNANDVEAQLITPTVPMIRRGLETGHAIIARDDVLLDQMMLENAPNLKVIGRVGAALAGIDLDVATERGIIVMNTPGTGAIAAAEHTIALMLALSRRLVIAHNGLKEGWWLLDRKRQAGTQLHGKALGIIGLGRTGRVVAQRALSFGMTVMAFDPYIREDQVDDKRINLVNFRELLTRSDYVSLHVPATTETQGMLNAEAINMLKPGARVINIAHGRVWDEDAIAQALKEGRLAGAAVDVFAEEPPYNSPLVGIENVVHTPHIAENTVETTQDLSIQIVHQVLDALRGVDYRNAVNLPFMPGMDFDEIRPYLNLTEQMGLLLHNLSRNPVHRVAVELRGEEVSGLVKPLTVALLKGMLSPILGEKVSYTNAPLRAAERGIQVTQTKGLEAGDYTNLVSCQVELEDGEKITMGGTLLDRKVPHIVQINHYPMSFVPEGDLLILGSYDKPGVIGRVGTLLASNNVNIGSWQTGRTSLGGHTLTVLSLDEPISDKVLDELRAQDFIRHAHRIAL